MNAMPSTRPTAERSTRSADGPPITTNARAPDAGATVAGHAALTGVRVAIAHDWLVTYAGSERVVQQLIAMYPDAALSTSLIRHDRLPPDLRHATPSFLQKLPGAADHHEWTLPLMPLAWRTRAPLADVDAVISSSHACAKAVRVAPGLPHLSYCHTPMRYAWDFDGERTRFPGPTQLPARVLMAGFRRWDRRTSERVTRFVANSRAVASRVRTHYGRTAEIVPPPVDTDWYFPGDERGDEFLYVGRLVGYKRADLVVEAFADLPHRLLVLGEGHLGPQLRARATPNVRFLDRVDGATLRTLYRRCRAMVFPADEDFGIAMAEAHACGAPVISVDRGGALDIVEHGVTGWLVPVDDVAALRSAVTRAAAQPMDHGAARRRAEQFSPAQFRRRLGAAVDDVIRYPQAR